jgi:uncharacterized protein (DUF2249 family)
MTLKEEFLMATHLCDVREDLRNGQEPFSKIMAAISGLAPGDVLELIAPFQPTPLYKVLAKQGYAYSEEPLSEGNWKITFYQSSPQG